MKREDGAYYWVKFNGEWHPMRWTFWMEGRSWWDVAGSDEGVKESELEEIIETKLEPPNV